MNRVWVVARNEFLKRVRTRWFVLTTVLGPLALLGFFFVIGFVSVKTMEGEDRLVIVMDGTGVLFDAIQETGDAQLRFEEAAAPEDSVRQGVLRGEAHGYLVIPETVLEGEGTVMYYSLEGGLSGIFQRRVEDSIQRTVTDHRLAELQVPEAVLDVMRSDLPLRSVKLTSEGETAGSAEAYAAIGFIMGFLIYIAMLVYGSVVMQGVIEEKLSRVVEIIVSSVRPFQLLLGKILGIGAMGLVQMTVWALLIMAGTVFSGAILALFLDPTKVDLPVDASQQELLEAVNFEVPSLGPEVFIWFVLFFLVGYLLYASLFSAIGSAVEQQQDAQGLMLPVMMPIIVSIIFIQPIIEAPNSTLAVTLSMLPFFSPIPMVVRVAVADVPFWQPLVSFLIMVATFLGSVWMSARIYRIGILMYGKKAKLSDLIRWMRYA
jgi:ABC-2 type transport system permease protein